MEPYVPEPTKPLPDITWMRLNTAARDSVHSSTKLKKSRSTWKGVQQIANTRTKTTGKGSRRQDDGVGEGGMGFFFLVASFVNQGSLPPWLSAARYRQMSSQR